VVKTKPIKEIKYMKIQIENNNKSTLHCLSSGDHVEKKEMIFNKLRWGLIGVLFVIFIFVILGIFEVFVGVGLVFFAALPFGGVSLILNGRRFIKYRKWYFNPSSFDMLFIKMKKL
jgi:hypothetical protein